MGVERFMSSVCLGKGKKMNMANEELAGQMKSSTASPIGNKDGMELLRWIALYRTVRTPVLAYQVFFFCPSFLACALRH